MAWRAGVASCAPARFAPDKTEPPNKLEHYRFSKLIVRRPDGSKGWVKLPLRWTVERTFAWLGQCRRLTKDRERSVMSAEAFVKLAMIHLMFNRLRPKDADAEFQYHKAA